MENVSVEFDVISPNFLLEITDVNGMIIFSGLKLMHLKPFTVILKIGITKDKSYSKQAVDKQGIGDSLNVLKIIMQPG
jgi:hypothetical protein